MDGYQLGSGRERGGKGIENKQHKWQVENRQEEVKNSMGDGEAKEFTCVTHGHELGSGVEGNKGEKKNGTTIIA